MKIAIINFSGNVGKTTAARQLLAPRLNAPEFAIETINAAASDDAGNTERLRGKDFGALQADLMDLDAAIVDIGASNVEDVVKLMGQFEGSHEEFDYYLVPTVAEKKQQLDTVNTIKALAGLGVPPERILVVFNKVDQDDVANLEELFGFVCGYHERARAYTLNLRAVILASEIYDRIRPLRKSVAEMAADASDYRALVRQETDEKRRAQLKELRIAQQLARSAQRNLDAVFAALFPAHRPQ